MCQQIAIDWTQTPTGCTQVSCRRAAAEGSDIVTRNNLVVTHTSVGEGMYGGRFHGILNPGNKNHLLNFDDLRCSVQRKGCSGTQTCRFEEDGAELHHLSVGGGHSWRPHDTSNPRYPLLLCQQETLRNQKDSR
ncbi:hypothetical protein Hamer_G016211 [Homarus americanus]|uniref:Uncharacterized protein n=1 Tax=Homarus americanus TaxID=6706 RepID=A0A8J5KD92_HOMAM|nr:hypothetical protein Hamer_G016211 [Homarus americanus]